MHDTATKGDERSRCPRCQQSFVAGQRIQQSHQTQHVERRSKQRDIEWTHIGCKPPAK